LNEKKERKRIRLKRPKASETSAVPKERKSAVPKYAFMCPHMLLRKICMISI
jgi:hypothetical protein